MKEVIELKVSSYTEYPGPRYIKQGENSGEKFYNDYLSKKFSQAISENKLLNVNLDGTAGYASSFIDEVFGNLLKDFEYKLILEKLKITSNEEESWVKVIFEETLPQWKKKLGK